VYHDDGVYTAATSSAPQRAATGNMAAMSSGKNGHLMTPSSQLRQQYQLETGISMMPYGSIQDKERQYYEYVKDNLIMFGDGLGTNTGSNGVILPDEPSVSTGLSQEELLQRKRREDTWRKRKEKRQQKKHRVVNLPSSLFSTNTSRQQQSQGQQQQQQQHYQPQMMYQDIDAMKSPSPLNDGRDYHIDRDEFHADFDDSKAIREGSGKETSNDRHDHNSRNNPSSLSSKGARGSMVSIYIAHASNAWVWVYGCFMRASLLTVLYFSSSGSTATKS
jgi:hypothetical protein